MPEEKQKGRDYPLAPTPKPEYSYKDRSFSKQDSSIYQKGFASGLNDKTSKPSKLGGRHVVGLSDTYNAGYSEGKDVAIVKRGDKGLDAYQKSHLENWKKSKNKK